MTHQRILVPSANGTTFPMDVYVPHVSKEVVPNPVRPAVVICPGGAYQFCSEREAEPIALRFVMHGFNAFVVWYREKAEQERFPKPQQDAASAVACVRANAEKWHTDPNRIAILGFSAGGHLAGSLGVLWHRAELWQPLGLTPEQVKPNALVLCYPVISGGKDAHRGSFENLTGSGNPAEHERYSLEKLVTENCPPAFLWHTFEDDAVPVQNSLLMAQALAEHKVPTELHIFPHGRHGSSLCSELTGGEHIIPEAQQWPELAARFLKDAM
ncbi:MAG: alpha/beta hydrolase [Clostridia bacterium]|nr:alpha/beta hydrolase [Clostridia bacterium]